MFNMKRLVPAVIILVFVVIICIVANVYVKQKCDITLEYINKYRAGEIDSQQLESFWQEHKEKLSLFVNHDFLDKITVYIGQLTLKENEINFDVTYKSIESVLKLIKAEQEFALHSFY